MRHKNLYFHTKRQMKTEIRKAVITDIRVIHKLLADYAAQGALLPRALSELYEHLKDIYVAVDNSKTGDILGVCALGICWEDIAEVKSLAVLNHQQGQGIGAKLVEVCLKEANEIGLKRIFALTYIPRFFSRFGFREVEKSVLPQKVWGDCLKCAKFPDCDEVAMVKDL